jgi:hypothetical protein
MQNSFFLPCFSSLLSVSVCRESLNLPPLYVIKNSAAKQTGADCLHFFGVYAIAFRNIPIITWRRKDPEEKTAVFAHSAHNVNVGLELAASDLAHILADTGWQQRCTGEV